MKHPFYFLSTLLFTLLSCAPSQKMHQVEDAWALLNFTKIDSLNPILQPESSQQFRCPLTGTQVEWESRNVLNPSAVVKGDKVCLFYRAQDKSGTSRIGMAISNDGLHFKKHPVPVFYPDNDAMKQYEWNAAKTPAEVAAGKTFFDGVEDPRIIEREDGTYVMTYTAYDGKTARLCLASSLDLLTWKKHGLVLGTDKYKDTWSKSGAIVGKLKNGRVIAQRINGKYWMYFGDTQLFMAYSYDLIHWEVAENEENHQLIAVLNPRPGYFDSRLVEPGPFALLTDAGILLIYNGSNAANYNDTQLPKFTYAAGQALFDAKIPYKLLARTDHHFIHPDKPYEKIGEVNEVCFVEGLVRFKDKWWLYYGTADSKVAVAMRK
jgi:predicted GH43/DUF377 family glycosyl hydrolase